MWPSLLPGGDAVLFTIRVAGPLENAQIAVLSLESGEYNVLFPGGTNPRYVPTGHIVYGVRGTLRAVGFDIENLAVTSEPIPVVDNVQMGPRGGVNFAVSDEGALVYISGSASAAGGGLNLVWVDREGENEPLLSDPGSYFDPKLSPDGTQLALRFSDLGGDPNIYVYDIERNNFSQLTFDGQPDCCPVWTPDGARILFSSMRNGIPNVYVKNADGTGEVERVTESDISQIPAAWTDDGEMLLINASGDIHQAEYEASVNTTPLFESTFTENRARVSPDGRWIAYESDEDGDLDIYVRPLPDVENGKWKVSTQGGSHPVWSPAGDELFFLNGNTVMAAAIEVTPTFNAGNPASLFDASLTPVSGSLTTGFDISPDGSRFMTIQPGGMLSDMTDSTTNLVVVFNWFEELQARVPLP